MNKGRGEEELNICFYYFPLSGESNVLCGLSDRLLKPCLETSGGWGHNISYTTVSLLENILK